MDKSDVGSTHDKPSISAAMSSLTYRPSVGSESVDLSVGISMELQESPDDISYDGNLATNDTPESQPKALSTPSWLKPLRLVNGLV